MNTLEFLTEMRKLGIKIWLEDNRIRFSASKGIVTPQIREQLSNRKNEISEYLGQSFSQESDYPPIKRGERSEFLPISSMQEALWFIEAANPRSNVYNMYDSAFLRGRLDLDALEGAVREIVRRHEAIRTRYVVQKGRPGQKILQPENFRLQKIDLKYLEKSERMFKICEMTKEELNRPFDLTGGMLFRALLYGLDEEEHLLLMTMHHSIADGSSLGIFRRELSILYSSFRDKKPSPLVDLSLQYADFAIWQRKCQEGEAFKSQVKYWRQMLKGIPVALELPGDHTRPAVQSFLGATEYFDINSEVCSGLREVGKAQNCSLFMVLLALYNVLLYRYSSQEDIVVGVPIAGRSRPELEKLYGYFVNVLPIRTDLSGNPSFTELLERLRENFMGALSHKDVPFEKLVMELQPKRDSSRNPIFQVCFSFDVPLPDFNLSGLTSEYYQIESGVSHFDLAFFLEESAAGIKGRIEYNAGIFDTATIHRLTQHFRRLMKAVSETPEERIALLRLLDEDEERLIVSEWSRTETGYPKNRCIHELFEQQAERNPGATALEMATSDEIKGSEKNLSYRELNRRANRLAHRLIKLGVGPEVCVGVFMKRSMDAIVSILAILKSGGAYVPLDPTYPRSRIDFMIKDAGAPVLIAESALADELPQYKGIIIRVDTDWESIEQESDANCINRNSPESLAYVIYTSGSTGKPKGVCVVHRGVVRLVKNTNYVEFLGNEVILQFAPISFDASTFEIWASLLNGARLVIFPPNMPTLQELGRVLRAYKITTLWLTASLFHEMVDRRIEDLKGLRQLLAGGEALSVSHVTKALNALPNTRLINGYGPTENTTFTCCHHIKPDPSMRSVPIGRPIANTSVYILDRHLQPTPIGVPGEMYTGGDGLARGYLNAPELTAERFIQNPLSSDPSEKLYKVGDMVRYKDSGIIEFLGRTDKQIKIRGFRIELGEIENTLNRHPGIQQSAVMERKDKQGDKYLAAYIVAHSTKDLSPSSLRAYLSENLPNYMVPSAFVIMDQMPLTANGKVDVASFPEPYHERIDNDDTYVAPKSHIEKEVCRIWCEILDLEEVGIRDNFFDLGGHSILVLRAISLINERLSCDLMPIILFEHPTVAGICEFMESGGKGKAKIESEENHLKNTSSATMNADLARIALAVEQRRQKLPSKKGKRPYRMRESLFCKWILTPLFRIERRSLRTLLQYLIIKLEGGEVFTITLRKLYARYFNIHIGDYSIQCFDVNRMQEGTTIGRYTGIFPTVMIRNGNHPRNTISTHSLFYHPVFQFVRGYELTRKKIEIGNDVFIGHNAIILYPTQRIGDGAVIAAGSVVVEDVPPYAIVGGYPAKILRYRFSKEKIEELLKSKWWNASLEELEPVNEQFMLPLEGDKVV
jgi:amino acid adenylation domain-containing protein